MSHVKINSNQFLGTHEYNRLRDFLDLYGIDRNLLLNTRQYGLFEDFTLPDIGEILRKDCLYVRKAGTPFDEIVVQKGVAVDKDANIIINTVDVNLSVPNDNEWYWVKAKHALTSKEKGTVSIDVSGNMTGVGTEFLSILRGQPKFPTRVKFYNSTSGNIYEYEVVSVISDSSAVLMGDFNAETNLQFCVYGTFTPGAFVPTDNKKIYQFDSIELSLEAEVGGLKPPLVFGREFFLSRVKNTGTDVVLEDKRIDWFKTTSLNRFEEVVRELDNPVIGVEAVKYDVSTSTKEKNLVELAFGFRFSSYTIDTSSKKVSILIGNGGVYKSTSDFIAGDFDGWRLYLKNGSFVNIIDSQKSGSQIVITLDCLNPSDFGAADLLFVAPPYENIEIKAIIPGLGNTEKVFPFQINTPLCRFGINSIDGCTLYNLAYRYKNNSNYTDWLQFPNDIIGHWNESSFQQDGTLQPEPEDRTRVPYVGSLTEGFIRVCEHPNSFDNFQQVINTGDVFGVRTTTLENSNPQVSLVVGADKKYQHFKEAITLSANIFIILSNTKADGTPNREGNEFFLHFEQFIDLSTFKLRVVQNFVDPTNFELIAEIDANDCMYIRNNIGINQLNNSGLFMTCTFNDLGKWISTYETETTPKNTMRMLSLVPTGAFNSSGVGVKKGYWGWRVMTEMNNRFPMGTSNYEGAVQSGEIAIGTNGGNANNQVTLVEGNIPRHHLKLFAPGIGAVLNPTNITADTVAASANTGFSGGIYDPLITPPPSAYIIKANQNSVDEPNFEPTLGKSSSFGGTLVSGNYITAPISVAPLYRAMVYIEKTV